MATQATKYEVLKELRGSGSKRHKVGETIELTEQKTIDALTEAGAIKPQATTETKTEKK